MNFTRTDCVLARESLSADLDGELDELDLRRLDAHLRVCADCAAWGERVKTTTLEMREAQLEALSALAFEPRLRVHRWRVRPALAVAPAVALVATFVVALGGVRASFGGQETTATHPAPAKPRAVRHSPAADVRAPAVQQHWAFWPI